MTTDFVQTYKNTLSGKYDPKRKAVILDGPQELSGGAKIKMKYKTLYQDFDDLAS